MHFTALFILLSKQLDSRMILKGLFSLSSFPPLSTAVDLSEIIEPSEVLVAGNVLICGAMVRHLSSAGG